MESPQVNPVPKQNLLRQIRPFAVARTATFYKVFFLDLLTVASALAFGYLYAHYVNGTRGVSWLIGAATLFGVCSVFETILIRSFSHRFYVICAETVALIFFFYERDLRTVLAVASVVFVLLLWGEIGSRYEMSQSVSVRFMKVARRQLSKAITALIVMAVVLYVPVLQTQEVFISESNFDGFYGWLQGLTARFFPELDVNSSVDAFAESLVALQLKNQPEFTNLPFAEQERFKEARVKEILASLSSESGVALAPAQELRGAAYAALTSLLKGWRVRFDPWFVTIWTIALFLAVESVGVFFYWLVALVAFIFFELLLAMGSIRIVGENQVKELAEFS